MTLSFIFIVFDNKKGNGIFDLYKLSFSGNGISLTNFIIIWHELLSFDISFIFFIIKEYNIVKHFK